MPTKFPALLLRNYNTSKTSSAITENSRNPTKLKKPASIFFVRELDPHRRGDTSLHRRCPEAASAITRLTTKRQDEAKTFQDRDLSISDYVYSTNPIESTFATVRLRTKVTKGPGSRAAGLAIAYKLIESAQSRRRAVNAPHLVALVRAGPRFHKGKLIERPTDITPESSPGQADSTATKVI